MSIARVYEISCDFCEEPIAAATYLTEARKEVRRQGGDSVAGMRPMQSVVDVCGKCKSVRRNTREAEVADDLEARMEASGMTRPARLTALTKRQLDRNLPPCR